MGACGVTVSKGHFVRGVATINWASAAGVSVDTVIFTVYATSRCTAAISATGQYWHADFPWVGVATNNKMQKARVGVTYYATITISNRQPPAVKSRCVTLGQFTR